MASTYHELYMKVRGALRRVGVESAALEGREIVCCAADKSKEEFYRDRQLYASDGIEQAVEALLQRRLRGEPVAYLVGQWEFFGLPLYITPNVLIPRSDTEVLAEQAITYLKGIDGSQRVLDLCTGSGCIGIALASEVEDCRVVLADSDEKALEVARQNVRLHRLGQRTAVLRLDALSPPLPSLGLGTFHCLVSNPPYIPTGDIPELDGSVRDYEPHLALDGGEDGLRFYRTILRDWKAVLQPMGAVLLEVGIGQSDAVLRLMQREGFGDLEWFEDTQGITRVVMGRLYTEI